MHLTIGIRGSKRDVDRFIEEIQAKYVPIDIQGKKQSCNIVFRPFLIGDLIFPEPQLQTILKTLEPMNWKREHWIFKYIKKILKLEKVPEVNKDSLPLAVWNKNIELSLIGIKKDKFADGYEQL